MKKLNIIAIGILMAMGFSACSEDSFEEIYPDPSKSTSATCASLLTGIFYNHNNGGNFQASVNEYTYNSYWRLYTWENAFGRFTQTIGYENETGSVYYLSDSYANNRWSYFYRMLSNYRQLENIYNNESADAQAQDRIFKDCAEVFLYDHLSQCVDVWGDMPFTKAGNLGVTGSQDDARVPFDDDVEIYRTMLSRLGELYTDILSLKSSINTLTASQLSAHDYINKGDLDKWAAYANSLRLRLAVHVSAQGSLSSEGQAAVKECLSRTLISNDENAVEVYPDGDTFNLWENFRDGYKDINNVASQPMIDAMSRVAGQPDYRMYVMYIANKDGNYIGASNAETAAFQKSHGSAFNGFAGGSLSFADRYYSHLDSVTYTGNHNFISPIISAAEVDFLRAEAIQSGWGSGDAKSAFINGMVNSTKFYYRQNKVSESVQGYVGEYPGDAAVKAYAEAVWDSYTNKLEAIMTMKWVHFGIIQPTQAFTDIRRTGYPALNYPSDITAQVCKDRPNRIKWPNSEKANNADNFAAAESAQPNEYSTKLFWAK